MKVYQSVISVLLKKVMVTHSCMTEGHSCMFFVCLIFNLVILVLMSPELPRRGKGGVRGSN